MNNRPELIMMIDQESGKCFLEIDSLIEWFQTQEGIMKETGAAAAYALIGMREKGTRNPTRIMSEEEFHAKHSKDVV